MSKADAARAPERHDLVWPSASGWRQLLDQVAVGDRAAIARWQQADWPAVVRRHDPADAGANAAASDKIYLGIALPPDAVDGCKCRIALSINKALVRTLRAPLALNDVIATAPPRWRADLQGLADGASTEEIALRVYGSLALQTLTGQTYLTDRSDIDILFAPNSRKQLEVGITLLSDFARNLPLDGEIRFPDGQAVAWKEWINTVGAASAVAAQRNLRARVLAKSLQRVQLQPPAKLLASLELTP
ncbi:malonate decarboxylase holo-[acyl-carrier-protein] synthase [Undibacterium arcticum]|uniref:Malonate decarboxylase holo-[acyl-carrier-protein] synthase n=1 Tax=Undibacterium arcticum TaxID=1762892 RepID=A0ABV7F3D9_9BURK